MPSVLTPSRNETVICVGDLHGWIDRCTQLEKKLRKRLGRKRFKNSTIVFLGDYVDRGPDTKAVLDWLIKLRDSRPPGKTRFIAGNHDFAMAAFLDCLPGECPAGFDLETTNSGGWTRGFWNDKSVCMHYQGRLWVGERGSRDSRYHSASTFASYGVHYDGSFESRERLIAAVPEAHKEFLRSLEWVCELDIPFGPGKFIAVHAGLDPKLPAEVQLAALRARRIDALAVQTNEFGRLRPLCDREKVMDMHPELQGRALLLSGHHGFTDVDGDRIIIDSSGGNAGRPLAAMILPERELVETDEMSTMEYGFTEVITKSGSSNGCFHFCQLQ